MAAKSSHSVNFRAIRDFSNSFLLSDVIIVQESKSAGRQFIHDNGKFAKRDFHCFEIPGSGGERVTAFCRRMKR